MATQINYVTAEQYDAIVAQQAARMQVFRFRKFARKHERNFTVEVVTVKPV